MMAVKVRVLINFKAGESNGVDRERADIFHFMWMI